jgi:starch-binding outer membrane protein, SusD/RagB family
MNIINPYKLIKNLVPGILFVAWILLFTGCDNFLDEVPDNRVDLNNLEKASQVLTNAYSDASYAFTDWMTDNVAYTLGVNLRTNHQEAYSWSDETTDATEPDSPTFFWNATYNAIAHANEVLAVLESFEANNDEDLARKRAVESEALLTRSYGHFMLVNLFARHYDKQRAGTDLGVPYVDTPETVFIKTYKRNTVQEVYDRVEADMLRGIELEDESFFSNSGKYHFNRNAALAFASRFYLYKGEYQKCIEYSNELLGNDPAAFVRDLTSDEFLNASSSIEGYVQLYNSPDLSSNLLLMRKVSLVQRTDFAHGPTSRLYNDLFDLNPFAGTVDERENPALRKGENGVFPLRYQSLFQRSSLNSNVGTPYHIHLAFRGEEVLFNRMESYVELNRLNDAIADLQILVDNRYSGRNVTVTIELLREAFGVAGDPFVSDKFVVDTYIQIERRKEFIVQGLRWFDIKRFELEVAHNLADGSLITLEEKDLRKVLQIPASAIEVGGLQPNPR